LDFGMSFKSYYLHSECYMAKACAEVSYTVIDGFGKFGECGEN